MNKSDITDSINHNFARIRIDSYNSLPIAKILPFQHVIILFKSVVNKKKDIMYIYIFRKRLYIYIYIYIYIFLEKGSYKDKLIHNIFK